LKEGFEVEIFWIFGFLVLGRCRFDWKLAAKRHRELREI